MFFSTATRMIAICNLFANSYPTSRKKTNKKNKSEILILITHMKHPLASQSRQTNKDKRGGCHSSVIRLLLTARALARHRHIITGGCTFVLVSSSGDKVRCSKVILECPSPPPHSATNHISSRGRKLLDIMGRRQYLAEAPCMQMTVARFRAIQVSNLLSLSLPSPGIMHGAPTTDSNVES